jgi:hypothetical protein
MLLMLLKTVTRTSMTLRSHFRHLQFFGSAALNLVRSHRSTEETLCRVPSFKVHTLFKKFFLPVAVEEIALEGSSGFLLCASRLYGLVFIISTTCQQFVYC